MQDFILVTGIIIKQMPIGESDRRVTILTNSRGKISAFARGARKPNSRFSGTTCPFCFGSFKLYEGRDAYNIAEADIKNYFEEFRTDLDGSFYAAYFAEIADYYCRENNDEREMMKLFYQSLRALCAPSLNDRLVRYIYEIKSIAVNGEYMGHIAISDVVKEDSEACVKAIKKLGVEKTVILTGDSQKVANAVGKELAIDEVYSQLMPGDKVEIVERLLNEKNKNSSLVFVGDGINDAPVISRADVGMAMGALGSDAAIESADIVLMDDKPSKLATAIRISKKTMGIVRQNIVFALAVKALVLILGALGIAGMWLAVFADVGVSVIAILNAMRAMKIKNADL